MPPIGGVPVGCQLGVSASLSTFRLSTVVRRSTCMSRAVIPYPIFAQALEAGSLKRVENLAREMPSIRLDDALRILELMARDRDPRCERAARRWLDRLAAETDLDPQAARACLRELPSRPGAVDDLRGMLA